MHVCTAFNLSMLVGGNTSVLARVRLGHFSDLQLGLLPFVFHRDTTTRGDLPPLPLHPFHIGNGITANLGDEGSSALYKTQTTNNLKT